MAALTELQTQILRRFFDARSDFFLTGGAALVGFHLRHRTTHDLDLFTTVDAIDDAERTLVQIASELGVEVEALRRSPTFRRFLLKSASESVVVDLARDDAPQLRDKVSFGRIIVDSPEEILANKLCALLSRVEIRDLFDVFKLSDAGYDPLAALPLAEQKDAGMSASQLAWILASFPVPDDIEQSYGVSRSKLEKFRDDLVRRLTERAFPTNRE